MSSASIKVYVLLHEWIYEDEGGSELEIVTADESKAVAKLKEIHDRVYEELTEEYELKVYTDTDYEFDLGEDGCYMTNHENWRIIQDKLEL